MIPVCCCCYPDSSIKTKFEEISCCLTKPFEPWIHTYCFKILPSAPTSSVSTIKETRPVLKEELSDAAVQ
jgi:hypothetical protein